MKQLLNGEWKVGSWIIIKRRGGGKSPQTILIKFGLFIELSYILALFNPVRALA